MKEFVKGQKAYVHSKSDRYRSYETTVVSIGKKYITCQEQDDYPKQRFDNTQNVAAITRKKWHR